MGVAIKQHDAPGCRHGAKLLQRRVTVIARQSTNRARAASIVRITCGLPGRLHLPPDASIDAAVDVRSRGCAQVSNRPRAPDGILCEGVQQIEIHRRQPSARRLATGSGPQIRITRLKRMPRASSTWRTVACAAGTERPVR